ncbi:hypothetical protein KIW84_033861 [Lathyrus oleraceus]|uniref:Late embryogenesis abundant protein LEA-2 subgroup domain-containing protein n=1 Tax=Pisum sativum TaxID=3888 RepID=A0A9D4XWW6_PEA|nr:hypothetical protein KIW84_033861 [Pisum sativum]
MKNTQTKQDQEQEQALMIPPKKGRHTCITCFCLVLLLLLIILTVSVVLALTLFKPKQPKTTISSATLQSISPAINIQVNVTLDIKIQVENRNRASFKHEDGTSLLMYEGVEVGDTDIFPGFIKDLMGGQLSLQTVTRIPGKVTFLGFIKKHIVAVSNCQFVFGVPDMEIKSQICKNKAKL